MNNSLNMFVLVASTGDKICWYAAHYKVMSLVVLLHCAGQLIMPIGALV